jgi:hypothetical protein
VKEKFEVTTTATLCYRCGKPAEYEIEDGSVVCDECEDSYQAFLREQYPFGQCQTCGQEYRPWTCQQGVTHIVANHVEGACGLWSDGPELEPEDIAAGYCFEGCRPALTPAQDYQPLDDLAQLPF